MHLKFEKLFHLIVQPSLGLVSVICACAYATKIMENIFEETNWVEMYNLNLWNYFALDKRILIQYGIIL